MEVACRSLRPLTMVVVLSLALGGCADEPDFGELARPSTVHHAQPKPPTSHAPFQTPTELGQAPTATVGTETPSPTRTKTSKPDTPSQSEPPKSSSPSPELTSQPSDPPGPDPSDSDPSISDPPDPESSDSPDPTGLEEMAERVVELTNAERESNGCDQPLRVDDRLRAASRDHSADMAERNYMNHTSPEGNGPGERAAAAGYEGWSGENIAMGYPTAEAVVDGWMNSDGHRSNILNCDSRAIGVGAADSSRGVYWTQMFGYE